MVDMKHTREQLSRVMQRQINKTKLHVNIMLFSTADKFQEKLSWLVKSQEGEVLRPYSESRWSYKLHFCVQKPRVNVVNIKQFSHSVMSDSLQPHGLQHARHCCPSPTPGAYPNPCPLSRWCHPTTSPSPGLNFSQHQGLFKWISASHQVAKVLEFQLQHHALQWIFRTDLL